MPMTSREFCVLILPATRKDGAVAVDVLERAGLRCETVADGASLAHRLAQPVGALIVADTALAMADFDGVLDAIAAQPAWSDVPVVLMSRVGDWSYMARVNAVVARLTNVTIIDRPSSVRTLLSAVQAALRARRRQYQNRDQITALRAAEEALRAADRRKDEFLATLAHELRNPLAPLRSALGVMRRWEQVDERHLQLVGMMDRQLNVMVRLIDDLLDVARITSDKIVLQKRVLDAREVIDAAVEAAAPAIAAAGHQLRIDKPAVPAPVLGDFTRLVQVVGNLLNNATKYTPSRGGRIELSLTLKADDVCIEVADNGVGIPAEMLSRVFDMFAQVNRTLDRAQGGLGIGLSLVRGLLDLHGGSIEVRSDGADLGSVFTVRLPRAEAALPSDDAQPGQRPDAVSERSLRVLIVDDNQDAADALAALVRTGGHAARAVYNGREAISTAKTFKPDIVFCDLGMPDVDGFAVANQLREDPTHDDALLVALTGWANPEVRREAESAGFDCHVTKPADLAEIESLLSQAHR